MKIKGKGNKMYKLHDILCWLLALYFWTEQVIEGYTVIYMIAAGYPDHGQMLFWYQKFLQHPKTYETLLIFEAPCNPSLRPSRIKMKREWFCKQLLNYSIGSCFLCCSGSAMDKLWLRMVL